LVAARCAARRSALVERVAPEGFAEAVDDGARDAGPVGRDRRDGGLGVVGTKGRW
jgi:hypothetical protein